MFNVNEVSTIFKYEYTADSPITVI